MGYAPYPGFLTLFTASSSFGLVGLFHPTNAFRLHPSGISPPEEQPGLSSGRCRHAVAPWLRSRYLEQRDLRRTKPSTPRRWGWCLWPTSRLYSPRESVPTSVCLAPSAGRAPPGYFPSPGFSPPRATPWLLTTAPPTLRLTPALPGCPRSPSTKCATES